MVEFVILSCRSMKFKVEMIDKSINKPEIFLIRNINECCYIVLNLFLNSLYNIDIVYPDILKKRCTL